MSSQPGGPVQRQGSEVGVIVNGDDGVGFDDHGQRLETLSLVTSKFDSKSDKDANSSVSFKLVCSWLN